MIASAITMNMAAGTAWARIRGERDISEMHPVRQVPGFRLLSGSPVGVDEHACNLRRGQRRGHVRLRALATRRDCLQACLEVYRCAVEFPDPVKHQTRVVPP